MNSSIILQKLETVQVRFNEIRELISDPNVMTDIKRYISLNKEFKSLESLVGAFQEYKNVLLNIESAKDILNNDKDDEIREMAKAELEELLLKQTSLEEDIRLLLVPADPEDDKNAILEIRAGTGGDEASIFACDLFRMYSKFCEIKKWKMEITNVSAGTVGGYKELIAKISGEKVYGILKYESGVHRVQRVPQTEAQGRVHTSAATIAVLPEADEFDIDLNPSDIRKDTYCSSGPGGQSVNTTYSAVRLTHVP